MLIPKAGQSLSGQSKQLRNLIETDCPSRPRSLYTASGGLFIPRGTVIIGKFALAVIVLLSGCRSTELTRQKAADIIQKSKSWTDASLEFRVEKGVELSCLTDKKLVVADIKNAFERDLRPTEKTAGVLASGKFSPTDDFKCGSSSSISNHPTPSGSPKSRASSMPRQTIQANLPSQAQRKWISIGHPETTRASMNYLHVSQQQRLLPEQL